MPPFTGFTPSETFTQIPDAYFRLLKEIDDLAELKVTLFALWSIEHTEGNFRALRETDFDPEALGLDPQHVRRGLKQAVGRGVLIEVLHSPPSAADALYFVNSPRGRLAAEALAKDGRPKSTPGAASLRERSNVFKLYEENIGPLTPLISDFLIEAEKTYPSAWFEAAFEIAVSRNIRNWKYIEAILSRWKEKGKDERKDRQDPVKDAERYADGEFSEFLKRD
jgi:DnaD/phage-associated family protein